MTKNVITREDQTVTATPERPVLRKVELTPIMPRGLRTQDEAEVGPPRRSFLRRYWMSLTLVWLPMLVASIYLFGIAADVYVSETKYIVRTSSGGGDGGLGAFMQSQGLARAVDETYAVNEYLLSRDAASWLAANSKLKELMSRPEGDLFNRYPGPFGLTSEDRFYKAYQRFVEISVDSSTGISTLEVHGFRPADAQELATALLKIGEQFVNTLNTRAHTDALSFAETLSKEAHDRLANIESKIADFRNKELIVDPRRESSAALVQLGVMSTELSRLEANLAQQEALAPKSPSIASQKLRIRSLRDEMAKLQSKVVGGRDSIADKLRGFEMLTLEQELAAKSLAAATIELEKARRDAETQRIYLQQIVKPDRPDQPMLPRRLLDLFLIFLISMAAYWVVRSFTSTALDHET